LDYDLVVVGAGPSGNVVARAVALKGFNVLILEEHETIGLPVHCTGKVSVRGAKELDLRSINILHEVKGANFYAPDMSSFTIKRGETQAYIIDRKSFDKYLSKKAISAGAELITEAKVKKVRVNSDGVQVIFDKENRQKKVISRVLVDAGGARSTITRSLDMYTKTTDENRLASQYELSDVKELDQEKVNLFFGKDYAPGFFAWIVPIRDDVARVGLCVSISSGKTAYRCLNKFIKNHPIASEKLKSATLIYRSSHLIPVGGTIKDTITDGVVIVGDAAGQVKSTTGGGLYYGILCSKIAGEVISEALSKSSNKKIIERKYLEKYQNLWRKKIGKEILYSVKIRNFIDYLSDEELNKLFNVIKNNRDLVNVIETEGDIDFQFQVVSPLLKRLYKQLLTNPQLLFKLIKAFI
jgi:geranylgeranyl reductase family protein